MNARYKYLRSPEGRAANRIMFLDWATNPDIITARIESKSETRWTSDLIERAASLWTCGYAVSAIAALMGYDKDQLSGMIHRNRKHFPRRPSPIKRVGQ